MLSFRLSDRSNLSNAATLILFLVLPAVVLAKQIHVPADYATIQAAIDASSDSDTVYVGPGTYVENISFSGKDILLKATGGAVATTIQPANLDISVVSFVNGESRSAVIDGFRITNTSWQSGVECSESSPTIKDCEFVSCTFVAGISAPLLAISSAPAIIGNTFHDNQNSIHPNGPAACIELRFSSGPALIQANQIYDNVCSGVFVNHGTGPVEVSANRIFQNDEGIAVHDLAAGCNIHHNLVYKNSNSYGIVVMGATASVHTIESNTLWRNNTGLYLALPAMSTVRATNNIIANSDVLGVKDDLHFAVNNIMHGNALDFAGAGPSKASYLACNPRFVSSLTGDFTLLCESPAIDRGLSQSRDPDSSKIDIGALSYTPSGTAPNVRNFILRDSQPLQIGNEIPTFSWSPPAVLSERFGLDAVSLHSAGTQLGFELQVGTDQDWTTAELMSTGEIFGTDTTISYAGPPLVQGATCFARLRIRDENGWSCWRETVFRRNRAPAVPTLLAPLNDLRLHPNATLAIANIADDEFHTVNCQVEIFSDDGLNDLFYSDTVTQQGANTIAAGPVPALVSGQRYWWRARAADSKDTSAWSDASSFLAEFPRVVAIPDEIQTIQQAVNWAIDGDTLLLAPGTYTSPFSLKQKALTIMGASGPDSTILVPLNIRSAAFDDLAPDPKTTVFSGLCFDKFGGVFITRGRTEIVNCRFLLKHNGSSSPCVFVTTSTNVEVCEFLGPAGIAVGGHLDTTELITICDSRFVMDTPDDSWRPIIYFWKLQFEPEFKYQVHISNNLFIAEHDNSIIDLQDFAQGEIRNNTFADFRYAINLDRGNGVAIKNNTFTKSDYSAIVSYSAFSDYNNFWDVASHYAIGSTAGAHDISVNPLFVDADNHDFGLQCGSLCIDAGDPATTGCIGKRIDIGAYEYDYLVGNASGNTTGNPVNITDAVYLINYLFTGGAAPCPIGAGQIDCDEMIGIGDAVALINYLFARGPAPCTGCL